jgi:hypothetical protein
MENLINQSAFQNLQINGTAPIINQTQMKKENTNVLAQVNT